MNRRKTKKAHKVRKVKPAKPKAKSSAAPPASVAAVTMLAKAFQLSPDVVSRLVNMPDDQLPTARGLAALGSWVKEILSSTASGFEGIQRAKTDAESREFWRKHVVEYDEALGIMMRNTTSTARFRAQRSESTELLVWAISDVLHGMERLPALFEQYERIADPLEFEADEPDTFPCQLVEALVALLRYCENQNERHPERFRLLASELPYWPFLVTPHRAGYRKRFDRLAGKGFLSLGTECPLDTSRRGDVSPRNTRLRLTVEGDFSGLDQCLGGSAGSAARGPRERPTSGRRKGSQGDSICR